MTRPFEARVWKDDPDVTTPLSAANLIDMETRLAAYADLVATLPFGGAEVATPVSTTSATLEDVTGASFTLTLPWSARVVVLASFEMETASGASASTIGVTCNVDGTDHLEHQRYLSGLNDKGIGAIVHLTDAVSPAGDVDVKLRFRRVSGVSTPALNNATIIGIGLYASE